MSISFFPSKKKHNKGFKSSFRKTFGFRPGKNKLYELAFRHKSIANKKHKNNERLEFLGDSILGAIVAEYLYKFYPKAKEGFMSNMRSKIVNRASLNDVAFKIGLEKFVKYDKSGKLSKITAPDMFGNAFEAFIGAIYLDKGYRFTKKYIENIILKQYIDIEKVKVTEQNYKGKIYEYGQKHEKEITFVIEESDDSTYQATVLVNGEILGVGKGSKKKDAEQEAAKDAFHKMKTYR